MTGMMGGKQRSNAVTKGEWVTYWTVYATHEGALEGAIPTQNSWDYAIRLYTAKVRTGITDITRIYGYQKLKKQKSLLNSDMPFFSEVTFLKIKFFLL